MTRWRWMILLFAIILTLLILRAFAFTVVELKDAAFSYRPEAEPVFIAESTRLRNQNNGFINRQQELELYHRIVQSSDATDMDLDTWSSTQGKAPRQFRVRVRVKNYGDQASVETPVTIKLFAKVGEYYVDQSAFMVDQQHLASTAKWVPVQTLQGHIPVLARNEDYDYFSDPVMFGAYLHSLKNRYPTQLKAEISLLQTKAHKTIILPVQASHFALEDLNR